MDNAAKLIKMKQKIEESRNRIAVAKGQRKELLKRLEEEFGCKSLKEAKAKLKELANTAGKLEAKIEKGISELEKSHDWK